jgi:hypothetical protein
VAASYVFVAGSPWNNASAAGAFRLDIYSATDTSLYAGARLAYI